MTRIEQMGRPTRTWTLVSVVVVVAILYLAKGVLVPLMLALLLSFLLAPVCDRLERWKLNRVLSVLITAVLTFTVLGVMVWTASVQMFNLAPKLPEYQNNIQTKLRSVNGYLGSALNRARHTTLNVKQNLSESDKPEATGDDEEQPQAVRVIDSPSSPLQLMGGMFGSLLEVFGSAGIVIVLVVFFLLRRDDLRDRFIRLVGGGRVTLTTQALEDATARVSRYLLAQLLLNVMFGTAVAIGLYFIGLPNALLWGFMAAILRFIPYVGPWIAALAPIGLSMANSASWVAPILTVGLFIVLELFTNNVMEPWFYGKNTGVSPVAVLLAVVFWTWLWGPIGLLLATPLTVCLLVIGKHVPRLSFLHTLLGSEPVFEMEKRVYQRLLAGDQEEAAELLLSELEKRPLVEVYDSVVIPALNMAETHWHFGEFNEKRHEFILQGFRACIEELAERQQETLEKRDAADTKALESAPTVTPKGATSNLSVLCLPAHSEADEIAGMMLAQLLAAHDCTVEVVTVATLVSERVDLITQQKADIVCISAASPGAVMHARYLYRRLHGQTEETKLIVGLWDLKVDMDKATDRIGCSPGTHMAASLADAVEQVRSLVQVGRVLAQQSPVPVVDSTTAKGAYPDAMPVPVLT